MKHRLAVVTHLVVCFGRFSSSGEGRCTQRVIVDGSTSTPRFCIISTSR